MCQSGVRKYQNSLQSYILRINLNDSEISPPEFWLTPARTRSIVPNVLVNTHRYKSYGMTGSLTSRDCICQNHGKLKLSESSKRRIK